MTIQEFMEMCIDMEKGENVWSGAGDEIPEEYGDLEFGSFDVPKDGQMTFNLE